MLVTFILLGKYLESIAKGRTSEVINKLMSLQVFQHSTPLQTSCLSVFSLVQATTATLVKMSGDEILEEKEILLELVEVGDILKV